MSEQITTSAVIDCLGGIKAVAALTGRKYTAVHNWTTREAFPPDTYLLMKAELEKRGHRVPPALWRMVEAAE